MPIFRLYTNNLKNGEFGKEAAQNFCLERMTIAERQGASVDRNFDAKLMQSKTNYSGCLCIFLWLAFLTGGVYPLAVLGIAQLVFSYQANGSLIGVQGKKIGSVLIAQSFKDPKYFWSRPSAIAFNPLPSGGSNLSPPSITLKKAIEERRDVWGTQNTSIPSDLLFASGSGLDPHISPEAALFQLNRIKQARGLKAEEESHLKELIKENTEGPRFFVFGAPAVNILKLNLALDEYTRRQQ